MNKTEHRVLEEILRQLKPRFNPAGLPNQKLWDEIATEKRIILDELEGMNMDDLKHFTYVISRQYEIGKKIEYIAITRNNFILEQLINDDATWSTLAGKNIVELKPYTFEQLKEVLMARAHESIDAKAFDEDIISLIADVALNAPGHMRTGVEILKNAALLAEMRGDTCIGPDDVREVNREDWVSDLSHIKPEELVVLLSVAHACRKKSYTTMRELRNVLTVKLEEYTIKLEEKQIEKIFQMLLNQDFIYHSQRGYTILNYPIYLLIAELEKMLGNA